MIDELARCGVSTLFHDTPQLNNDPQTQLLTQVQGVIAEYERAKIAERYRRGKLWRARAGEVTTRSVPTVTDAFLEPLDSPRTWKSTSPKPA